MKKPINYSKNKHCTVCNKLIDNRSIRCKKCSNEVNAQKRIIIHTCLDCGKQLSKTKYKRCASCARLNIIQKQPIPKGRNHHNWIGGLPKCINCGKELKSRYAKRCEECNAKWQIGENNPNYGNGDKIRGDKTPNWIDGRSFEDYPPEFNKILKAKIRNRDNYICQCCNMTEEEHLIVYGSNLPVHHIDYDKQNCKENNLIALCDGCNLRANWNREYWQEFYMEKISKLVS